MHKDFQWSVHTHAHPRMRRHIHTRNFFWSTYLMALLNIQCGFPKNKNMSEYSCKCHELALILYLTYSVRSSVIVGQHSPLQISFSVQHRIQSNVKDCIPSSCLFHLYCLLWLTFFAKDSPPPTYFLLMWWSSLSVFLMFAPDWIGDYAFLANKLHARRCVLLQLSHLEAHSVCLSLIADVHFDHLVRLLPDFPMK